MLTFYKGVGVNPSLLNSITKEGKRLRDVLIPWHTQFGVIYNGVLSHYYTPEQVYTSSQKSLNNEYSIEEYFNYDVRDYSKHKFIHVDNLQSFINAFIQFCTDNYEKVFDSTKFSCVIDRSKYRDMFPEEYSEYTLKQQSSITTKDIEEAHHPFNRLPEFIPDPSVLPVKVRLLLQYLEIRSYPYNGDTKIYDERLAQIFEVSVRTIQRYLRLLDKLGFINRLNVRVYDYQVGKPKSIRYIRCNRVFLACGAKMIVNIPWKQDHRPKFLRRFAITREGKPYNRNLFYSVVYPTHTTSSFVNIVVYNAIRESNMYSYFSADRYYNQLQVLLYNKPKTLLYKYTFDTVDDNVYKTAYIPEFNEKDYDYTKRPHWFEEYLNEFSKEYIQYISMYLMPENAFIPDIRSISMTRFGDIDGWKKIKDPVTYTTIKDIQGQMYNEFANLFLKSPQFNTNPFKIIFGVNDIVKKYRKLVSFRRIKKCLE